MFGFLRYITVEPTMILYMMAFMTTSVVEQAFFVNKACRVNMKFNASICDNISAKANDDYNSKVQVIVSDFHQWNDIAGHIGPVILAMFMGAWSDRRGRKLPLLIGLIGKLYYSSMVIVNDLMESWPVEYVIYTATLPMAFTGADVAIFAAAYTYISDMTTQENRTLRVTILEVCYLATMPTGIALGNYLFTKVTNRSYTIMFSINASLLVLALLYSFIALRWRTNEKQRPLREAPNVITDFFDYGHVVQTFKTLLKKRPMRRRTYFILLIIGMACYTCQRDEKQMSYLYLQKVLNWDFESISHFRTYISALQDVVLLTAIPLLSKMLGWEDAYIIMLGALSHSVARIFYANTYTKGWLYVGGAFAAVGPVVAPVIRSMVSKIVAAAERGKAFSLLSVADNAVPLISGVMYSQVYKATIHSIPSMIYYVTIITQGLVFIIILFIHSTSSEHALIHEEEEVVESCLGQQTDNTHTDNEP